MEQSTLSTIRTAVLKSLGQVDWRNWLPSRGNVIFTLVIVFALFWAQAANALPWSQPSLSPTSTGTWPYQGRLADSAGTPITATVPMVFRLYSAGTSGVPLWEENWTGPNSVQVSDGLFNVMLGSLNTIPQSLVNNNGSLWLGITAGTDDEMTPRIQLGSVPFAVQALTVPDGSIGTAKLETSAITTEKLANGSITQAKLGADVSMIPPDKSVTPQKLALPSGKVCLNNETTVTLPGNYSAPPVPGLSTTISLDAPSKVLVWSAGLGRYDGVDNYEAYFVLMVNGQMQVSSFTSTSGKWFDLDGQRLLNLPAGQHSLTASIQSAKAGSMTLHNYTHFQTCLYYIVLAAE